MCTQGSGVEARGYWHLHEAVTKKTSPVLGAELACSAPDHTKTITPGRLSKGDYSVPKSDQPKAIIRK